MKKKNEINNRKIVLQEDKELFIITIPMVEYSEPKIKIYDYTNNGSYYYRNIGFKGNISDD